MNDEVEYPSPPRHPPSPRLCMAADDAGLFHYMTGSNLREIDPADAVAEEHLRAAMALADDLEDETFVVRL